MYTQQSTEYALISAGEHHNQFSCILYHVYITKKGMLLCDVTMTLVRQEKIGNIFFLEQHICFL